MPPPPPPIDTARLLEEDGLIRGLARGLLRDVHEAEDVAQQTWLAALAQPLPAEGSLRGWLASVVRHLASKRARTEGRERAKVRSAPRGVSAPSAAAIVAREATRAEVVRAVLALDEIYRAPLLLRYFENLPPRAVARQLGLPVETVRTRLKRALAQLRARLDAATEGGRQAWAALLLPFTKPPVGTIVVAADSLATLLTGAVTMTVKAKAAALVVALGALLFLAIRVTTSSSTESRAPQSSRPESESAAAPLVAEARPEATATRPVAGEARRAEPTASGPTTGSMLVHVVWEEDKAPAPGVLIQLIRDQNQLLLDNPHATSDETGTVKFDALAPGRVMVLVVRGDTHVGGSPKIEKGKSLETTVAVPAGLTVRGIVTDERGAPVANADVLVAGWGGGDALPITRSAADGTFELRSVATHCHIGASAPGYGPSPMRQFTAAKGAQADVRIVLPSAGAPLTGLVLDPQGKPVAGAAVRVGLRDQRNRTLPDGGMAMGPQTRLMSTDENGRFSIASLEPCKQPLSVRARGLAPWNEDVELRAGRANDVTIRLLPGATLVGTVTSGSGAPVARAEIRIGDWGDLGHVSLRSGADGTFRAEGLAVGELEVRVESEEHGKTDTKLRTTPGETLRWDPVLGKGLELRGRVIDADGAPVADAMVEVHVGWFAYASTDKSGRFTLSNCPPGVAFDIEVSRKGPFPDARVHNVVFGSEELLIRLPKEESIFIKGTVLGPDGKALGSVHVSPLAKGGGGSPAETASPTTGEFKYGPYPPGEYSLRLRADGYPPIAVPPRVVAGGETWDVGTLTFRRGGVLVVACAVPNGTPMPNGPFAIYDDSGDRVSSLELSGGAGRSQPLSAGKYALLVGGDGIACESRPFEITADSETRLELALVAGVTVNINCTLPAGVDRRGGIEILVEDANGSVVARSYAGLAGSGAFDTAVALRPGNYRVVAQRATLRGEAAISVSAPGPMAATVGLAPSPGK